MFTARYELGIYNTCITDRQCVDCAVNTLWNVNECANNSGGENLKATVHSTGSDRPKTAAECGIFQLFGQHDNN